MTLISNSWIIDISLLTGFIVYLIYKYLTYNFDYWSKRTVPYLKPLPFFGNFYNAAIYKEDFGTCLKNIYDEAKGPFVGIWVFTKPHFIVRSPELVKAVLVKDFNCFSDRTLASDEKADPVAANFLFLLKNPMWKNVRSKMTPVFTSGKIKNMFELINKAGEDLKLYLGKKVVHKEWDECKEICAKYSTEVLTSTAFGIQSNCFDNEQSEFRNVGRKMFSFDYVKALKTTCYFFLPEVVSLFRLSFFEQSIYDFLRPVFWETIKQREDKSFKRNDLIDIIVEMKKNNNLDGYFSNDRVVSQAVQFYAAGFETVSSTMAFTLYELCLQPHLQERLRSEIQNSIKSKNGITYESIQDLKYLHMVVSETLRKYPVLPFLDRRCNQDYKVPNSDVVLEKGTPVYIPMMGLHMDPQYFPNPEKYDPERFNETNIKKIPPYAYIPFGEGPHNCIGARFGLIVTKVGLLHILSEFEVVKNEKTPVPIQIDPKSFIMQSKIGLPMTFKKLYSIAA